MQPLISSVSLYKSFQNPKGLLADKKINYAVQDVTIHLFKGETVGLVGESGCGKSTLARIMVGLLPPTSGDIFFAGQPIYQKEAHKNYRLFRQGLCHHIQMVFQDPYSSLNPRMRIVDAVAEPLICSNSPPPKQERLELVNKILQEVGINPDQGKRYPHEFSGGQRQRIAIARALVSTPDFIVCDEPTSSLDASVQGQILNLVARLQEERQLTYLFISHDLAVIRHMSDRILVMYSGQIVEEASSERLFNTPMHPYTRLLLASACGKGWTEHSTVTPTLNLPDGCSFAPRCPLKKPQCLKEAPPLLPAGNQGHQIRCFLYN